MDSYIQSVISLVFEQTIIVMELRNPRDNAVLRLSLRADVNPSMLTELNWHAE